MDTQYTQDTPASRTLTLERRIDAPPQRVWRAWTEPELLKVWFTPRPWTVSRAELDVRPGGSNLVVMCSPEGEEFPNRGVYLDVVPGRRLVMSDAYVSAWEPSEKPFMTATIDFLPDGGGTLYRARVTHWSEADRTSHEKMGFHEGWGAATDQLVALVATLGD